MRKEGRSTEKCVFPHSKNNLGNVNVITIDLEEVRFFCACTMHEICIEMIFYEQEFFEITTKYKPL